MPFGVFIADVLGVIVCCFYSAEKVVGPVSVACSQTGLKRHY